MRPIKAALIGINGFGKHHLARLLQLEEKRELTLTSVCELHISPEDGKLLRERGIRCYSDYKQLLSSEKQLDFVTLSIPIHLHAAVAIEVMKAGVHTFVEKPPAAVIQDADRLIEMSLATGKHCAVNYLMVSGQAFSELVRAIEAGELGTIRSITGTGLLQRTAEYFSRNQWAGKLEIAGHYVLDGSIHNALSHVLHNMLILAGTSVRGGQSAKPVEVTGELYRANDIEGEDTSCMRIMMSNGVQLYFYATLCSPHGSMPCIRVEGTEGNAVWGYDNTLIFEKGESAVKHEYKQEDYLEKMYKNLIRVINGEEGKLLCPVGETRNTMLVSNGAFESSRRIHTLDSRHIRHAVTEKSITQVIENMEGIIASASERKLLFSEAGVEWAVKTAPFDVTKYDKFPVAFRLPKEDENHGGRKPYSY